MEQSGFKTPTWWRPVSYEDDHGYFSDCSKWKPKDHFYFLDPNPPIVFQHGSPFFGSVPGSRFGGSPEQRIVLQGMALTCKIIRPFWHRGVVMGIYIIRFNQPLVDFRQFTAALFQKFSTDPPLKLNKAAIFPVLLSFKHCCSKPFEVRKVKIGRNALKIMCFRPVVMNTWCGLQTYPVLRTFWSSLVGHKSHLIAKI